MPHYEKLLIQIVNMAHICDNDMILIKDMFQIVDTWLQFSTEAVFSFTTTTIPRQFHVHKTLYLTKSPSIEAHDLPLDLSCWSAIFNFDLDFCAQFQYIIFIKKCY